jgi:hypothetical protein
MIWLKNYIVPNDFHKASCPNNSLEKPRADTRFLIWADNPL